MLRLKAGFSRIDITPPLGVRLAGYFIERISDGILDPLMATAIAVSDGEKSAVVISIDLIGIPQTMCDTMRKRIGEKTGLPSEAVFLCCTHTHLGPEFRGDPSGFTEDERRSMADLESKLVGVAQMALDDMRPATMYIAQTELKDISFIRRYRMKDGTVKTNPGWQNPDILHPLGASDDRVALTLFKRENAPEIAVVNFQTHADTISGNKISADFPGFVRKDFEKIIDNSLCMYINGTEGDTNHIDVRLTREINNCYGWSRHMGRAIACAAASVYGVAKECPGVPVAYGQKNTFVEYNKGTEEELAWAEPIAKLHQEGRDEEIWPVDDMYRVTLMARANRIVNMSKMEDRKELHLTALAVGKWALAAFPGEPFTWVGLETKAKSPFDMTYTACTANGTEGYYPTVDAYDEGGYEAETAKYRRGTAEQLVQTELELLFQLYESK